MSYSLVPSPYLLDISIFGRYHNFLLFTRTSFEHLFSFFLSILSKFRAAASSGMIRPAHYLVLLFLVSILGLTTSQVLLDHYEDDDGDEGDDGGDGGDDDDGGDGGCGGGGGERCHQDLQV